MFPGMIVRLVCINCLKLSNYSIVSVWCLVVFSLTCMLIALYLLFAVDWRIGPTAPIKLLFSRLWVVIQSNHGNIISLIGLVFSTTLNLHGDKSLVPPSGLTECALYKCQKVSRSPDPCPRVSLGAPVSPESGCRSRSQRPHSPEHRW